MHPRSEDPDRLTERAHDLLDRYEAGGDVDDLQAAVDAYERALAVLTPADDPWTYESNLGNGLRLAFERLGERAMLDRSLELLRAATARLDRGEDRAFVLDNLALVLRDLAATTGEAAMTLAGWAAEERQWTQAAEAYRAALAIAADYTGVQLSHGNTKAALAQLRPLAADAAYAFSRAGVRAEAITAAERGRAVLLAQALALGDVVVRRLALVDPPLAGRFRAAADRLGLLMTRTDTARVDTARVDTARVDTDVAGP